MHRAAVGLRSQASVFLVATEQMKPRLCVLAPFSNRCIFEDTSNDNVRGVFPHLFLTGETVFPYSAPECKKTMCLNNGNTSEKAHSSVPVWLATVLMPMIVNYIKVFHIPREAHGGGTSLR